MLWVLGFDMLDAVMEVCDRAMPGQHRRISSPWGWQALRVLLRFDGYEGCLEFTEDVRQPAPVPAAASSDANSTQVSAPPAVDHNPAGSDHEGQ